MRFVLTMGGIIVIIVSAIIGISMLLVMDDLVSCVEPELLNAQCAPADAIVVVSGGDTAARTAEAIKLYKNNWAPKLLVAGAALDETGPSNAAAMRRQAIEAGVPQKSILVDHTSQNTLANALNAAQLLKDAKRIIVVTSPYHQRRATLEFQQAFGRSVTVVGHPTFNDAGWNNYWWATPLGWWLALSETIKTLFVIALP